MVKTSLFIQTKKVQGNIRVRFRLRDGRKIQLYHRSDIVADVVELRKLKNNGYPKHPASYNKELSELIKQRIHLINKVYYSMLSNSQIINTSKFQHEISEWLRDNKENIPVTYSPDSFLSRFKKYIDSALVSTSRKRGYMVAWRILHRYLSITGNKDILVKNVGPEFLISFREFLFNEYEYACSPQSHYIYKEMKSRYVPRKKRSPNTVASKMKMLHAFFVQLEDADEINKSPFRRMGKENRHRAISEQYCKPVALTKEELRHIITTEVPKNLKPFKDCFLIQCALGCRIGDFSRLDIHSLSINNDGVPFIHYIPRKTSRHAKILKEVETPLTRFAYDIICNTGLNTNLVKTSEHRKIYNRKIRELLGFCKITREVEVINDNHDSIVRKPLHEFASSKLCRKTNVTLMAKVQINSTVGGLHEKGSDAVNHYLDLSLKDLHILINRAFGEHPFIIDKSFRVMSLPRF